MKLLTSGKREEMVNSLNEWVQSVNFSENFPVDVLTFFEENGVVSFTFENEKVIEQTTDFYDLDEKQTKELELSETYHVTLALRRQKKEPTIYEWYAGETNLYEWYAVISLGNGELKVNKIIDDDINYFILDKEGLVFPPNQIKIKQG